MRPLRSPRATSVQKRIRTLDIEEVGKTARHGTFFQMAGNSPSVITSRRRRFLSLRVADYLSGSGGFGLDPERLWVTIYEGDEEAFEIWTKTVGFPLSVFSVWA